MRLRLLVVLLLGAVLLTGCGTVSYAASHAQGAATRSAAVTATSSKTTDRDTSPETLAADEAAAILAQFVPPPGAVRLKEQPTLPGGSPRMGVVYTTVADATGYWRVRGDATALLAWEKAHMPKSFSRQDVIIGPPSWNTVYTLPPVPGKFAVRELNAQFYAVGGGETVIMADAMVAWVPPRPAAEMVPSSVKAVTIELATQGFSAPAKQATVTSATVVRRLAALVNGLPPSTIGPAPCPSGLGFTLTFSATAGGPPVAVAQGPSGCGSVTFRLNGKSQPGLMVTSQSSYDAAVLKIAGLPWKLP
jgi:uncharacterized protein YceK